MNNKDQRRINGPEKTVPYSLYQTKKNYNFLDKNQDRQDKRTATDVRPLFMNVGQLSQAAGSSFVEVGNTKIICAVYGPKEIQRGADFKMVAQVCCDVGFTPFSSQTRKASQTELHGKEMSNLLKEALEAVIIVEKFPKVQIDINITVVEDGGSALATSLTAASLALSNAGIGMYELLIGASLVWHKEVAYIDPTNLEENNLDNTKQADKEEGECKMTIGMMPKFGDGQIVLMMQEGPMPVEAICDAVELAAQSYRECILPGPKC